MTWDITTPAGTEAKSLGDDRIRELKTDLQSAFRADAASGVEAVFPGSDTAHPVFRYRGLRDTTAARPAAGQYGLYFDTTRNALQRDNGSSWADIATLIPAGTVMVFYQAAAPVGWTKITTQNDKALRVVSGTGGGSGGTNALSSAHTHTYTLIAHKHDLHHLNTSGSFTANVGSTAGAPGLMGTFSGGVGSIWQLFNDTDNSSAASDNTGSYAALAYIDVICASKD